MTATTSTTSLLAGQIADLRTKVNDLRSQKVTYLQVPVTSINTGTSTFGALVPNLQDGSSTSLSGIPAPPQFMPSVGQTVQLALSGAQVVYQPTQVAPGTITPTHLSPDSPNAPTGLSLSTSPVIAADGVTHSTITASWTRPANTIGGAPISGSLTYIVQARVTGTTNWSARTSANTSSVITGLTPGTGYDVQVAAIDQVSNVGAFTSISTITSAPDTTAPSAPTTPTVSSYLGQLRITWDGKLSGGVNPPADFAHAEVHLSSTSGFSPSSSTLVGNLSTAGSVFFNTTYGTTMFAKLLSVDLSGNKSSASAQGSGSSVKVAGADITSGAVDTAQLSSTVSGNISTAQSTANTAQSTANTAQSTADTASSVANKAQTTADGKNTVTWSTSAASGSGNATGDIWYQESSGVIVGSWRWSGTAWVSRTFGDSVLNTLTAGKITAGTITANVTLSGRLATALTGARTEMNSLGFQKFDSGGNLIVSITGTQTLLQGNFKTASSGRRIEINSAGSTGSIDFYAPNGQDSYLTSYTEPNAPNFESIQMSMNVGGHYLWNAVNIDTIPQIAYHSSQHEFGMTVGGSFRVGEYTSNASFGTGLIYRLKIDGSGLQYAQPGGTVVFDSLTGSSNRIRLMPTGAGQGGGSVEVGVTLGNTESPRVYFFQNDGGGAVFKSASSVLSCRNITDSAFITIGASGFTVSSDAEGKANIDDARIDAMATVRGMRVRSYQRILDAPRPPGDPGPAGPPTPSPPNPGPGGPPPPGPPLGPPEIGLVAQEAPPEILGPDTGPLGIDLYAYTTVLAGALQQLDVRVATLEQQQKKGPVKP